MPHESSGGWHDFKGDYDSIEECMVIVNSLILKDTCIHIIDTQTGLCVYEKEEKYTQTGQFKL
jgi:hypothetical protein